ncbi:MAG: hypothetical protein WAM82_01560 [Thermoanaerobaculia bacterium]
MRLRMIAKDWTTRKGGGVALLLASLGTILAGQSPIYVFISLFLFLAGVAILLLDCFAHRKSQPEARLSLWITPIKIEKLGLVLPIERGTYTPEKVVAVFVQNKGQQTVNCYAHILVEYGISDWTRKKEARACWYKGNSLPYVESPLGTWIDAERLRREKYCDCVEIASGEICQFVVAILFEGSWAYKWTVPYTYEKRTPSAENSFLEASTGDCFREANGPKVRITVTVIPDIPPVHDLPCTYIQIEGKEASSRII